MTPSLGQHPARGLGGRTSWRVVAERHAPPPAVRTHQPTVAELDDRTPRQSVAARDSDVVVKTSATDLPILGAVTQKGAERGQQGS